MPILPEPSFAEYSRWLRDELGVSITAPVVSHYESSARRLTELTQGSAFWQDVRRQLREFDDKYYQTTETFLLMNRDIPEIKWKPYLSMLEKSYRKNVLGNTAWPNAPEGGWITPQNWFSNINDPIRTFFVVKYLDGVPFLVSQLEILAASVGTTIHVDYEAREEGYYAAHVYLNLVGEIPSMRWDMEQVRYSFEIQVTTQLQDAIRPVTHPYYATRRIQAAVPAVKWQWQFDSDEFHANYLSHTLHHVEALIVDVRNRARRKP